MLEGSQDAGGPTREPCTARHPATGSGSHGVSAASDAGARAAAPAQLSRPRPLSRATPGPLLGRNLAGCRLGRKGPAFRHPSHRGHAAWGGEQVEAEPMAKDTQETVESQKGNWRCHSLCLTHGRGRGYFSPWSEIPRCLGYIFLLKLLCLKVRKYMGKGKNINTLRYRKNKTGLVGRGAAVPSLSSVSLRGLVLTERCCIQALN